MNIALTDPAAVSIEDIDVSNPVLYQTDSWRPWFARLRDEDPVHWTQNADFGGFWSVTRFADIVAVDKNHHDFSSEPAITIGDYGDDLPVRQFIAMDPPLHDIQRKAVQGVVAPRNLADLETLIRHRVVPCWKRYLWVRPSTG